MFKEFLFTVAPNQNQNIHQQINCVNSDITLQWNSTQQQKVLLMDVSTLINFNKVILGKEAKHKNLYDPISMKFQKRHLIQRDRKHIIGCLGVGFGSHWIEEQGMFQCDGMFYIQVMIVFTKLNKCHSSNCSKNAYTLFYINYVLVQLILKIIKVNFIMYIMRPSMCQGVIDFTTWVFIPFPLLFGFVTWGKSVLLYVPQFPHL